MANEISVELVQIGPSITEARLRQDTVLVDLGLQLRRDQDVRVRHDAHQRGNAPVESLQTALPNQPTRPAKRRTSSRSQTYV
jgi:hypothetical protein